METEIVEEGPDRSLSAVVIQCGVAAQDNGWHDRYETLVTRLRANPNEDTRAAVTEHLVAKTSLIGCEVAEAIEELRDGHSPSEVYESAGGKPEGYGVELADVVIRTFDLAWMLGINLEELIATKLAKNRARGRMHGGKKI